MQNVENAVAWGHYLFQLVIPTKHFVYLSKKHIDTQYKLRQHLPTMVDVHRQAVTRREGLAGFDRSCQIAAVWQ